jgi:ribonucleotide reductase beta subunit family protein with ferritin-like domain
VAHGTDHPRSRREYVTATSHLHDPQALYRQWESEQWNPWAIDLAADRDQWQRALSEEDKGLVYWALSSLMVAEERITTKFAGLVMAAETEEEASYLASQQVDEARHMQF